MISSIGSGVVVAILLTVISTTCARSASTGSQSPIEPQLYSSTIAKNYNYCFGKEYPFLPSNIQTTDGGFIDPKEFPTAQYCGHCHQAVYAQWRQSAHSNANRAPWYLKNVNLLNTQKGVEFSRHCEGCHDPIAVVAGALTPGGPKKRPYDEDGVSCMVCHSIRRVDTRGTGSFTLGEPAVLLDGEGNPIRRAVSDNEILSHLDRHSKAVMRDFYRTSEYCATCHEAALPKALNGYKWQRAISLYDEWQSSAFAKQSPLPFYKKETTATCQTCHMPREKGVGVKYPEKNGAVASHRWLGANTMVPKYYGFDEQSAKVIAFLQNSIFNVDIFALELDVEPTFNAGAYAVQGKLIAPLGVTRFELKPGARLTVSVVIQNKGIAHSHVPEQRDMYESWVDFTVKDAAGKILGESGGLSPDGTLDVSAHSFTNRLVNSESKLNDRHEVWTNHAVPYNNTIQSGRSQLIRYSFTMPQASAGGVVVTAIVKYRRFDQHFIDFGMRKGYKQPVVDMASASRIFLPGVNLPTQAPASENKEWMRWNNYGVALLDAMQYRASIEAFGRVVALRPEYADGYINMAIAENQWEKYDQARPHLLKALAIEPNNPRALYYLALVKRNEGDADGAIAILRKVAEQSPRSRDVHRELGFTYYQQGMYDLARVEYETVQDIAPDDLSAHYTLSSLYQRLGMQENASREAQSYADQKTDPAASAYAVQYLRQHPEIVQESIPWHVHNLSIAITVRNRRRGKHHTVVEGKRKI
jgi:tetratricopeptide (TPR) repeat protein